MASGITLCNCLFISVCLYEAGVTTKLHVNMFTRLVIAQWSPITVGAMTSPTGQTDGTVGKVDTGHLGAVV